MSFFPNPRTSYANIVIGFQNNNIMNQGTRIVSTDPSSSTLVVDHSLETNSVQSVDNNSDPLYLHNNDQPGMVLICKKLTGIENHVSWKKFMQFALSAKNKLVIVTGEFVAPTASSLCMLTGRD